MAGKRQQPNIPDEEGIRLEDFLRDLDLKIQQATHLAPPPEERDEDLKWVREPAPNAIQWVVGPQYLNNTTTYDHKRQYQIIRDFFELRCPMCNSMDESAWNCWKKTRMYLESETLLEWSNKYQCDVCPGCNTTRHEYEQDGLFKAYNQLHGVVGMRGGKTVTAALISTFIEHRVYTLHYSTPGGLSAALKQVPGQPFEITFIASSDVQSQDTVWAQFIGRRLHSPWVQRYIRWVKEIEKRSTKISGIRPITYEEQAKSIDNGHLNLTFNSMNSNSAGLAGRTRLIAVVDELSRFQNSESRLSADEAYRVLENSLQTVRSMADALKLPSFLGSMISISSPIEIEDKSMRLLKQAPALKRMYAFHYPTWDFNPFQPREAFDDAYTKDPIGAERDFGANPPMAASPLIEDTIRFRQCAIDQNRQPNVSLEYYEKQDKVGNLYKAARCVNAELDPLNNHYIVFDAGLTFDTFGGASAHGEWWEMPGQKEPVWITVFDWVLRIIPEAKPRRDVWFDSVMDIVQTLYRKHRIGRIEFDRWNSATLIQSIRDLGVPAEQRGTMTTDFVKFVADANMSRVRMLPYTDDFNKSMPHQYSAEATAIYELERLERTPDLRKIFNPHKGERRGWNSDDIAQCIVHAHRLVQEQVSASVGANTNSREHRLRQEEAGGSNWGRKGGAGNLFHPRSDSRRW
jgi:hypothetical protein